MRLIFLGSGEFGLPTFRYLRDHHEVVAVLSQPDRPAGRHRQAVSTPIAAWAQGAGLTVLKSEGVNDPEVIEKVKAFNPDAGVVIAFGQKLGQQLIESMGGLAINLHASLLPKYRGAAPINWAIINDEQETGLSVIGLSQRMDGGLIYGQAGTRIDSLETAGELHDRLAQMGPELVAKVLDDFRRGALQGQVQEESCVTKAPKLSKADGWVDFDADAQTVRSRVQGLTPWPGVRVRWVRGARGSEQEGDGTALILRRVAAEPDLSCFIGLDSSETRPVPGTVAEDHRVVVRDGWVRLLEVQVPGGRPMRIDEFVRGHRLKAGDRLVGGG